MTTSNTNCADVNDSDRHRLATLEASMQRISDALVGDLTETKPGLFVRVDRIEQNIRAIKWLAGGGLLTGAAAVATLVKMASAIKP